MSKNLLIRKAELKDSEFIADAIIGAEKAGTDKLSLSTLFNLPETIVRGLIVECLKQEVAGSELSLDSFMIAESMGIPAASAAGWVEGLDSGIPSGIIKANLLNYIFPKESIFNAQKYSLLIQGIALERDKLAFQIEYVYTSPEFRGRKLAGTLIRELIRNSSEQFPDLRKAQVQVFANNMKAINLYKGEGFRISKSVKSEKVEILSYLPSNEKILMEKRIKL